jgi:general secretion pathway protein G
MFKRAFICLFVGCLFLSIGLFIVSYIRQVEPVETVNQATRIYVGQLCFAVEAFGRDMGRYPTEREGLGVLIQPPVGEATRKRWHGPYLERGKLSKDFFGHDFAYEIPSRRSGQQYDIYSLGADGRRSDDDIGNW